MKPKTKGNLIIFRLALTAIMLVSAFALFPSEIVEAAPNLVPAMPTNLQASDGTYTDKVYITWNGSREPKETRGKYPFDTCAMTVIHIPASERKP